MSSSKKTILVAGATGKQGGATVRRLLAQGWRVRALTRDSARPAARELADIGAEVTEGDLDDRASLDVAARGVFGVYNVHPGAFDGSEYAADPEHEVRAGMNLADAAVAAGAQHLIYSSATGVGNSEMESVLPMLARKRRVEEYVFGLDISATGLRPTTIMENYLGSMRGLTGGTLATPLKADTAESLIAVADIAVFASLVFADPKAHDRKVYDLAGDRLTQVQIARTLSEATGRDIGYTHIPVEQVAKVSPDAAAALDLLNRSPNDVEIAPLRQLHPGLLTFDEWARDNADALIALLVEA